MEVSIKYKNSDNSYKKQNEETQVVAQTEDIQSETTRKTAADRLFCLTDENDTRS